MPTLVCVPIKVVDAESALTDATLARNLGADLVEFRVDAFFNGSPGPDGQKEQDAVIDLVSASPLPCIVTCRPTGPEGGEYDGDEAARIALFERLAIAAGEGEHPPRYLDVELATFERSANVRQKIKLAVDHPEQIRDLRTSLILSTHDFEGRPADLFRRLTRMRSEPAAAVLKLAYLARSIRDNLDLFDLLEDADRPMIALAMGQFGLMSRVLAPKFGGFLTFASLRPASATAPGQPTLSQLLEQHRFRSVKPTTRVFGLLGFPVEHSISPVVHNAGFEAVEEWTDEAGRRAGGIYLPMPVPPGYEHFKATLLALLDHRRLDFSGCSVTIPHKESLVRLAKEEIAAGRPWTIDAICARSGAGNTLVVERDAVGGVSRCRVLNTDVPAAIACLTPVTGPLAGKRVGILGTGGVARGIAAGALLEGAEVVVLGRSPEKAGKLAAELDPSVRSAPLDQAGAMRCDAYVNCTPLGMKGGPGPSDTAIDVASLAGSPVIMDTVYNPLETPLLRAARAAGLHTVEGLGMFLGQAALQFEAWTGTRPPSDLYERLARKALFGHNDA